MNQGGSSPFFSRRRASVLTLLLLTTFPLFAHVDVFGPKSFTSAAGAPSTVRETFTLAGPCDLVPAAVYTLAVAADGISSASIVLNGTEVVRESDFSRQVQRIERPVVLRAANTLEVTIKGGTRAGTLTVAIGRHIDLTESVFGAKTYTTTGKNDSFRDSFAAAAAGSYSLIVRNGSTPVRSASVRLNGTEVVSAQELTGTAGIARTVTLAATNTLVVDTKSERAGAAITVAIVRHLTDATGPAIDVAGLTSGEVVGATPLRLSGIVTDPSGVARFTVNGTAAAIDASGAFVADVALSTGPNTIALEAADCEGNTSRVALNIIYEDKPSLTIDAPQPGAVFRSLSIPAAGTVSATAGIQSVIAGGHPMTVTGTSWSGTVTLAAGEGDREIVVAATDVHGRQTTKTVSVVVDTTAPEITVTEPLTEVNTSDADVAGKVADAGAVQHIRCNGVAAARRDNLFRCTGIALQPGANSVSIDATDAAGNVRTIAHTIHYAIDTVPPVITAQVTPQPSSGGWLNEAASAVFTCTDNEAVMSCTDRAYFFEGAAQQAEGVAVDGAGHRATTTVTVNVDLTDPVVAIDGPSMRFTSGPTAALTGTASDALSGVSSVTCNDIAGTITANTFACSAPLSEGWNIVTVAATDRAGNVRRDTVRIRLDSIAPQLTITEPAAAGTITNAASVAIAGVVTDLDDQLTLTVGGSAVSVGADGVFAATVMLSEGGNSIEVRATDRAGNAATTIVQATYVARAEIEIASPADYAVLSASSVDVAGTISGPVSRVDVNDVAAVVSGNTFTARSVPLAQGRTVLTVTAVTPGGQVVARSLNVYRDSIPPRVAVYSPAAGSSVSLPSITVSGMVDDIVIGTINAGQVEVTVNGVAATVANRAFTVAGVSLAEGPNTLTIAATDQAGNTTTTPHVVTRVSATQPRLMVVSGDGQTAAIGALLPQPVKVRVVDAAGAPIAGRDVTFAVVQNDGVVAAGSDPQREVTVATDALGESSVRWTLGHRAGAGNQRLRVSAAGVNATAEVHASGLTGTPALVVVDMGNNQFGVTGEVLPRPLVAVVVDTGGNRLADVPVTFSVAGGDGSFDGAPSIVVQTDSDGRATALPRLGPISGPDVNVFHAAAGGTPNPAMFVATGRPAGPVEETRISGVVLDNSNEPVPGVTLRIDETTLSTIADAQGQFTIPRAPVGYVKLIADGSTAQRAGTWPTLEFVMYTNAGQNNTIGMPIYLLPIEVTRGIQVDETRGGTLTMAELPGFSLKVAPGSALFPNGSRAGTISATLVHADKMPMVPGFGQQPRFIVTLQPPGVHFDPPAPLTLPNLDARLPGEITEMYSFDHDLGQFVAIGTGTVSEDGLTVASDPGVGIIKGGWHCEGTPAGTGSSCSVSVSAYVDLTDDSGSSATATAGEGRLRVQTDAARERTVKALSVSADQNVAVVGACAKIVATGQPLGGLLPVGTTEYASFVAIDDPADPADAANVAQVISSPTCVNQPRCVARIRGLRTGVATIEVTYRSSLSGSTAKAKVKVRFVDPKPRVTDLSFENDISILRDDRVAPGSLEGTVRQIIDPVWRSGYSASQFQPVAYPATRPMNITAKFSLDAALPATLRGVRIEGEAVVANAGSVQTVKLKSDPFDINAGQTTFEVEDITTNWTPLGTAHFTPMTIAWKLVPAASGGCPRSISAGSTGVEMYFTLQEPLDDDVFLTALHLGVHDNYSTNAANIALWTWWKFSLGNVPRDVKAHDGRPLAYYREGTRFADNPASLRGLLEKGTGQCGTQVLLLKAALAVNGIDSDVIEVRTLNGAGMLIKNWTFLERDYFSEEHPEHFWTLLTSSPPDMSDGDDDYDAMKFAAGIPGQNSPTPSQKLFEVHLLLKVGSSYLDPSYGRQYSGPAEFQESAVEGFIFDRSADGPPNIRTFVVRKPGPLNIRFED